VREALALIGATSSRLPTDDDLVSIGRVGRPHGVDGAFVVVHPSDDPRWFEVGARVLAAGAPAEVVLARRVGGGRLAIKLDRGLELDTGALVPLVEDAIAEIDCDAGVVVLNPGFTT